MRWIPVGFRAASEEMAALTELGANGVSFLAGAMALWSLTAGLGWTQSFAVEEGLFSSWMVWAMLAAAFHWVAGEVARASGAQRLSARSFLLNGLPMVDRRMVAIPVRLDRRGRLR
ncbi:MAG: hypothetical protein NTV70_17915 [Acidobacteria bacterium]|nr:hypothetical protein [Acidobacteriota bacterium]